MDTPVDTQSTTLASWLGEVESILPGSDADLLRELIGAIDAIRDGSIRLTKSGIPPKPLWSALNDRLQWQDPRSVLYDWDEVDQIRFVYCLAMELKLIQPDEERTLLPGAGADAFFLSSPARRGVMLARAYRGITDWDERCDARNTQGHRQNFGQTFRRDFRLDSWEVRQVLMRALHQAPPSDWVLADALALRVTEMQTSLLISEDDTAPPVFPGEPEPEIRRLVHYWVFLAARFGWLDLARTPETDAPESGQRVFRLTAHGRVVLQELLQGDTPDPTAGDTLAVVEAQQLEARRQRRPLTVLPTLEVVVYRRESDVGDEYLVRRISEDFAITDWDEPSHTYRWNRNSLQTVLRQGMDAAVVRSLVFDRSATPVPATALALLDDAERALGSLKLTWGGSAVELFDPDGRLSRSLRDRGFQVFDDLVLVPWTRWVEFAHVIGQEPTEAFDYPIDPEEPLGRFDGNTLQLEWPLLPMVARDLLDALEPAGEPLQAVIDEACLARLARLGWSPRAVAEALAGLTANQLSRRLKSELR
jgi:hypothetical protein